MTDIQSTLWMQLLEPIPTTCALCTALVLNASSRIAKTWICVSRTVTWFIRFTRSFCRLCPRRSGERKAPASLLTHRETKSELDNSLLVAKYPLWNFRNSASRFVRPSLLARVMSWHYNFRSGFSSKTRRIRYGLTDATGDLHPSVHPQYPPVHPLVPPNTAPVHPQYTISTPPSTPQYSPSTPPVHPQYTPQYHNPQLSSLQQLCI